MSKKTFKVDTKGKPKLLRGGLCLKNNQCYTFTDDVIKKSKWIQACIAQGHLIEDGKKAPAKKKAKVEKPKVEAPKVEEPKVEEPKIEAPKVEEPKVEKRKESRKEEKKDSKED